MKRVTIHHQGDVVGKDTVIVDEDGQRVENVKAATIYLAAGEVPEVTIELSKVSVVTEGQANAIQVTCPCCGILLTHDCKDSVLGEQPEEQEFIITQISVPSTGGQSINGMWVPYPPVMGSGFIKLKPVPPQP